MRLGEVTVRRGYWRQGRWKTRSPNSSKLLPFDSGSDQNPPRPPCVDERGPVRLGRLETRVPETQDEKEGGRFYVDSEVRCTVRSPLERSLPSTLTPVAQPTRSGTDASVDPTSSDLPSPEAQSGEGRVWAVGGRVVPEEGQRTRRGGTSGVRRAGPVYQG